MKKSIILTLILILLVPSVVTAEPLIPGTPKFFSVEVVEEDNPYFILRWMDEEVTNNIYGNDRYKENLIVQINFYIRDRETVILREMNFKYADLKREANGYSRIDLDLQKLGIVDNPVNLMFSSYCYRVRIGLNQRDILGNYTLYGNYSPPVTNGKIYPYNYASPWAILELDKASDYDLIPESINSNMKEIITREEFAEVMVNYYESKTEKEIKLGQNVFSDTENQNVLKASTLGIITGYEDGSFKPENPITRQDIAVVITRTLQKIDSSMNIVYEPISSENGIRAYAYDSVMFLVDKDILKGDDKNNLHPLEHTTREQAVLLTTRAYEKFD